MPDTTGITSDLLNRLRLGENHALDELISHACKRLRSLASRMLKTYPGVRRWEETEDVLQQALIRLCRALEA